MKRILIFVTGIAALSAALLSCQKVQSPSSGSFLVKASFPSLMTAESKATFADGEGMSWEGTDNSLFRMVEGTDISPLKVSTAQSITIDPETGIATFAFDSAPAEGSTVSFFYGPGTNLEFDFKSSQSQTAAGKINAENLCFKAVGASVTEASAAPQMQLVGTVQRFLIYSSTGKYAAEKVEAVKVSSTDNVTGLIGYNGLGQPRKSPGAEYAAAETETLIWNYSKSATVTVSNPVAIEAKDKVSTKGKGIYISLPAGSVSSYTYQITTDAAEYILTSNGGKTYENGRLCNVFINLENASVVRAQKGSVVPEVKYVGGLPDTFTLNAGGGTEQGVSYWYATVDGTTKENRVESSYDGTPFYSTDNVKFTATDENGAEASWISCKYKTGDTWWLVTYEANTTGAERTATITATYNIPGYIVTPSVKSVKVIQPAQ